MPFSAEKFDAAPVTVRTQVVPVPELAAFFDEGEDAVFVVRALTGVEFSRVIEASQRVQTEALQRLLSSVGEDKGNALAEHLGLKDGEESPRYVRTLATLQYGVMTPELDRPTLVRLATNLPDVVERLSSAIQKLTGQGNELGKLKPSGQTRKSAQA